MLSKVRFIDIYIYIYVYIFENLFKFKGTCTGLVIRTGDETVMGRIAILGMYFFYFNHKFNTIGNTKNWNFDI